MKPYTPKDRAGNKRRTGGLKIIPLSSGEIRNLPEHAAFILIFQYGIDEILEKAHKITLFIVKCLGKLRQCINKRKRKPAKRSEPEVLRAACDGIGPRHLSRLIIAMIIKSRFRILHKTLNILILFQDIGSLCHLTELCLIAKIERLRHKKPVKPDLIRINLLVPEISGSGTRLRLKL